VIHRQGARQKGSDAPFRLGGIVIAADAPDLLSERGGRRVGHPPHSAILSESNASAQHSNQTHSHQGRAQPRS
jgi:hypothetical protein